MNDFDMQLSRRLFLQQSGLNLGGMAVAGLLSESQTRTTLGSDSLRPSTDDGFGLPGLPHFAAKAKRVIFLTQSGGPSQIDLFDHKPLLEKLAGTDLPESVRGGQRLTGMTKGQKSLPVKPAVPKFSQHGQSGATVSEWLPNIAKVSDEICFIKSMVTDQINHAPAMTKFLTGHQLPGRPSFGCWVSYGLGSECKNLPDYVVLISKMKRGSDQPLYDHYWGNGFLPGKYQGVKLRNSKDPVLYLRDPNGLPRELRRSMLDAVAQANELKFEQAHDPEIATRIQQYEMAFRMQTSVPELADLSNEPESTFALYGEDSRRAGSYASNCILARRLAERGVRFIQLFHPDWDSHSNLSSWCKARCDDTDQASAALLTDLKQRGLLEDTLVIWGGEFGRTVYSQGESWEAASSGRDHHPRCFTVWLAGGGVQPGMTYGKTDDFSYNVSEDPVHVNDLHATAMHLLGIDHERFTFRTQGLDFKLTGVEKSKIIERILL
jgi:hypothetical protein